jgi:IS5 family transposase
MPDESTILRFRHRLEKHKLADQILAIVNNLLIERGLLLKTGTLVDATLIAAPSSTKNNDKARDPEMHSSQKGNQWHFGMKAHIDADADSGLCTRCGARPAMFTMCSKATSCCMGKKYGRICRCGLSRHLQTL